MRTRADFIGTLYESMYQIRTPRGRTSTCFLLFINDFGRFQSRTPKTKRFKIGGKTFEMTENEPLGPS